MFQVRYLSMNQHKLMFSYQQKIAWITYASQINFRSAISTEALTRICYRCLTYQYIHSLMHQASLVGLVPNLCIQLATRSSTKMMCLQRHYHSSVTITYRPCILMHLIDRLMTTGLNLSTTIKLLGCDSAGERISRQN